MRDQNGKLRIGVLASGSGSNLKAIMDSCDEGRINGQVVVVISDKKDAFALKRAEDRKIPAIYEDPAGSKDKDIKTAYNKQLLQHLRDHKVDLVCMAGYMRLLGEEVLGGFINAVMNIHPSLLPSFKGGSAVKDALESGVKVTGVTVHFADNKFDEGPVILQEPVIISEEDNLESLLEKIHKIEHRIYPEAISLFDRGRLKVEGRRVRIIPSRENIEI